MSLLSDIGWDLWQSVMVQDPPIEWIQAHVNLQHDPTAASNELVILDPYQIDPIKSQFDQRTRVVVICAVEQTGKSTC